MLKRNEAMDDKDHQYLSAHFLDYSSFLCNKGQRIALLAAVLIMRFK